MKTIEEFLSVGIRNSDVMIGIPSLNIPRDLMPQIPKSAYRNFCLYLMDRGILIDEIDEFSVGRVKLTQKDVDLTKIRNMMNNLDDPSDAEVENAFFISSDEYLLDGHHRFLALVYSGVVTHIPVLQVSIEMRALLPIALSFVGNSVEEGRKTGLVEDELRHYKGLRKAFKDMTYYQRRSRNWASLHSKKKFIEAFSHWHEKVKGVRRSLGTERGKRIVGMAIRSISKY